GFACEAYRIEGLEKAREGSRMPVVRRRREEYTVLEPRRDPLEHLRHVGVGSKARRREVVGLVNNEKIPAQAPVGARLRSRSKLLEHVRLLQIVVTGDDAVVAAPSIRIDADLALELQR